MATILIIEDDPAVSRLLELALTVEGHVTEVVSHGRDAASRLAGPATDLVLLDVMLPDIDGLTVLRSLREAPGWDGTRVVLVTALNSDEDVWRGWASGTDYYLPKPFELAELRAIVDRLLAEETARSRVAAGS